VGEARRDESQVGPGQCIEDETVDRELESDRISYCMREKGKGKGGNDKKGGAERQGRI